MRIPNYNVEDNNKVNFKQAHKLMPDRCFRMLICGPSGSGKTNLLLDMIYRLLYFDKIYLYAKNLEQTKYQHMMQTFEPISEEVGYPILEVSNDEIIPVTEMDNESQKIVIFDDFVCEKKQNPLIEYFIRGRHKNCSVIYLSQSFYKTPKDIRLNCSHFCIYDFPSKNERNMICSETGIPKDSYQKATQEPYSFVYLDKMKKFTSKNFDEKV